MLVETGEDDGFLAGDRIYMLLQTLRADLLDHALHRGIDAGYRVVALLQERLECSMACLRDRAPHTVRSDRNDAIHSIQRDLDLVQIAAAVGQHGFDNIAHEG